MELAKENDANGTVPEAPPPTRNVAIAVEGVIDEEAEETDEVQGECRTALEGSDNRKGESSEPADRTLLLEPTETKEPSDRALDCDKDTYEDAEDGCRCRVQFLYTSSLE